MKTYHIVMPIPTPSTLDPDPLRPTGDPALDAWTERTSALIQRFIDARDLGAGTDPALVRLVVYATSDALYERHGSDASFDKLDPAAMIGIVVRTLASAVPTFAEVLHDFYSWLSAAGEIEAERGRYLACYFETLLELHGAGPSGMVPTRASRRATANLARRITEARIRSEQRARKSAA